MNADITRILSILAQTASQQPQQPPHPLPHTLPPPDPRLSHAHAHAHAHAHNPPQYLTDPVPAPVDPAAITDWPAALKYVMNTLGKDEAVMAQIKKVRLPPVERTRG